MLNTPQYLAINMNISVHKYTSHTEKCLLRWQERYMERETDRSVERDRQIDRYRQSLT